MNTLPLMYCDSRELLNELLIAYGYHRAPKPSEEEAKRALSELPSDPAQRIKLWQREIAAAKPVLIKLVAKRRTISSGVPNQHNPERKVWKSIIEEWNDAIYQNLWLDIPPLCECCGVPVFRRASERISKGNLELSRVCSERCQRLRKNYKYKAKKQ
jgi:hypothetical protein